jgi:sulfite reductase beta subunit-like hemoprotein
MHGDSDKTKIRTLTIILPGGSLPLKTLNKIGELGERYGFDLYLSTAQNLRIYNIKTADLEEIKGELAAIGVKFKGPGLFPVPRTCIGSRSCDLGQIDTLTFSDMILARFGSMTGVKPKFKIAIAGCPAACSNAMLTDIGIVATKSGFDLYLGGKGGSRPKTGRRVVRQASADEVLEFIDKVVAFHNSSPAKKQRFWKHLEDPEFPYREEV